MCCSVANILHLPFVIMLTPPLQDVIVQWSRHRICCFLISVALLLGTSSAPSWFLLFARDHLFLSRLLGALRLFRRRLQWSRRRQSQLDLRGEWWFRDLFSWSFISMSAPMVSAPSWSGDDQARCAGEKAIASPPARQFYYLSQVHKWGSFAVDFCPTT